MSQKKVVKISSECDPGEEEAWPCIHRNVRLTYEDNYVKKISDIDALELTILYQRHKLEIPEHLQEYMEYI